MISRWFLSGASQDSRLSWGLGIWDFVFQQARYGATALHIHHLLGLDRTLLLFVLQIKLHFGLIFCILLEGLFWKGFLAMASIFLKLFDTSLSPIIIFSDGLLTIKVGAERAKFGITQDSFF
ncbi:hypothetical protein ACU8KH_03224 [Lachancea thermotolerans]